MTNVMAGIRVLEVAEYGAVPSAGAVLADWGADVIKVEHAVRGDPMRGMSAWGVGPKAGGFTYLWEPFNRGKRSIGIDISVPEGREVVLELAAGVDVFITNFLPKARTKLGIDVADIQAVNPKIVYGRGSAHGPRGADASRGGFDGLTYWQRSGAGVSAMPAETNDLIMLPAPAFGDVQTGLAFAGGIAAGLLHRERTGEGVIVDISLMSMGVWAMQTALVGTNLSGQHELPHLNRRTMPNPLSNQYRTSDGRFMALSMHQSDKYWATLCRLWSRDDLVDDPRYHDFASRAANHVECIRELDAIFAQRTAAEWGEILARQDGQWSKVQIVGELNDDQQAWDNGFLQKVDYGDGRVLTLATAPVHFNETPPKLGPAPEHGAHTEEVLLEAGMDWEQIAELQSKGAIS